MPKKILDLTVSENQTQNKINCKVFPNPSTHYFQIKLEDTQNVAQFCLYDLSGKLIAEQDFKQEIINANKLLK